MVIFSEKKIGNALIAGIVILTIFYNIGAGACIFFNVNPSLFNFFYKIVGTFLVFYALVGGLLLNKKRPVPKAALVAVAFWFLYTIRLLYDIEIAKVPFGFTKLEVYSFAFGGSLNISLAIIVCSSSIDLGRLMRIFKKVLILDNLIIVGLLILKSGQLDITTLFLRRSYFSTDAEDVATINSITIAINGALLMLVVIIDMWFRNQATEKNNSRSPKKINILLLALGLVNLLLGGSRGPFLFFGLLFFMLLIVKLKRNRFNVVFILKAGILVFVSAGIFLYFFGNLLTVENFALFNRLSSISESSDPSDASRANQLQSAWSQFLSSPIIGDRFVERVSDFYPHNIILEVLMATGIIGFSVFIVFAFRSVYKSFANLRDKRDNYQLKLSVINLFFLLICLTSGCLWNSVEFWIFSLLVIIQKPLVSGARHAIGIPAGNSSMQPI